MAPGRSNPKRKRIVLQPRDLDVLEALGIAGTRDTNIIWHRHFFEDKTGQSYQRRMNLLAKHGLVLETFIEVSSANGNGRAPKFYNLTPKGEKAVEDERGAHKLRTAYGDRLSPRTIRHRGGIGEMVLIISDACRVAKLPAPDWLLEYDTQLDVPKGAPFSRRFILCQQFKSESRLTCWPDFACQLAIPYGKSFSRLVVLYEYDRSTEDHPQLRDKLPPYEKLFSEKRYLQWWPEAAEAFLFFIFQTETRLQNAAKSFAKSKLAPRIRLAVLSELQSQSPITDPVWFTVALERRAIYSQGTRPSPKRSSS